MNEIGYVVYCLLYIWLTIIGSASGQCQYVHNFKYSCGNTYTLKCADDHYIILVEAVIMKARSPSSSCPNSLGGACKVGDAISQVKSCHFVMGECSGAISTLAAQNSCNGFTGQQFLFVKYRCEANIVTSPMASNMEMCDEKTEIASLFLAKSDDFVTLGDQFYDKSIACSIKLTLPANTELQIKPAYLNNSPKDVTSCQQKVLIWDEDTTVEYCPKDVKTYPIHYFPCSTKERNISMQFDNENLNIKAGFAIFYRVHDSKTFTVTGGIKDIMKPPPTTTTTTTTTVRPFTTTTATTTATAKTTTTSRKPKVTTSSTSAITTTTKTSTSAGSATTTTQPPEETGTGSTTSNMLEVFGPVAAVALLLALILVIASVCSKRNKSMPSKPERTRLDPMFVQTIERNGAGVLTGTHRQGIGFINPSYDSLKPEFNTREVMFEEEQQYSTHQPLTAKVYDPKARKYVDVTLVNVNRETMAPSTSLKPDEFDPPIEILHGYRGTLKY